MISLFFSTSLFADTGEGVSDVGTLNSKTPTTIVIIHGLELTGGFGTDLLEEQKWVLTMADAIANRLGGAVIYRIRNGQVVGEKRLGTEKEKIVLMNWIEASNKDIHGFSEAASDVIVSKLFEGSQNNLWSLDNLHFIGHSRGSIVSSEVIQRLHMYSELPETNNLHIDPNIQFTMLDAHPWDNDFFDYIGDPLTAHDKHVNEMNISQDGVIVWKNIRFSDNYFHQNTGIDIDLNGLPSIPGNMFNKNLSHSEGYENMNHGGIHAWYHGTINKNDTTDGTGNNEQINIPEIWYPNSERDNLGYNFSKSINNANEIISDTEYSWYDDKTLNPWDIFNGSFEKSTKYGRDNYIILPQFAGLVLVINSLLWDQQKYIPGWRYHLGEESSEGYVSSDIFSSDYHLILDNNNKRIVHNFFYIPENQSKIFFKLKIIKPNPAYKLQVELKDESNNTFESKIYSLNYEDNFTTMSIPLNSSIGKTRKLVFELDGESEDYVKVAIDDVSFESIEKYNISIFSSPTIPLTNNNALKKDNEKRILFSILDNLGRVTGIINDTTVVTEIPESEVITFVDTLGNYNERYLINLPRSSYDQVYNFEMNSNNFEGNINIGVNDIRDKNSKSIGFDSLQFNSKTRTTMVLDSINESTILNIDFDGNGSIDDTLTSDNYNYFYDIISSSSGYGFISPYDTVKISHGDSIKFKIIPDTGSVIKNVWVDDDSIGPLNEYKFVNVNKDHSIFAEFEIATGIESKNKYPASYFLAQNYPNPFNPSTEISFGLKKASFVNLEVYNLLGKKVATLLEEKKQSGLHSVSFDGSNLSTGVYYYRIQAGNFTATKKMLLVK
ncbi:MAG: T9SS type A sorting domain-containing protein [Calditrichaeota bacterium]|nr:T9SS type A sorting domain-containing protein [Calditrichota bacterium]